VDANENPVLPKAARDVLTLEESQLLLATFEGFAVRVVGASPLLATILVRAFACVLRKWLSGEVTQDHHDQALLQLLVRAKEILK